MSNSLDPDQARRFVQTVCQGLQQTSLVDKELRPPPPPLFPVIICFWSLKVCTSDLVLCIAWFGYSFCTVFTFCVSRWILGLAEWPRFEKELLIRLMVCPLCIMSTGICNFSCCPCCFRGPDCGFWLHQSSIMQTCPCNEDPPYTPLLYSKTGVYTGIHFFSYFYSNT